MAKRRKFRGSWMPEAFRGPNYWIETTDERNARIAAEFADIVPAHLPAPKPVRIATIAGKRRHVIYIDRADGSKVKEVDGAFTGYRTPLNQLEFIDVNGRHLALLPEDVRYIGQVRRVYRLSCLRCEHKWEALKPTPKQCPSCRSPYWDKPREREMAKQGDKERELLRAWQSVVSDVLKVTAHATDADEPGSLRFRLGKCYRETVELLKETK